MKNLKLYSILIILLCCNEYLLGQCNVLINSNAITGSANLGGSGSNIRWLCPLDSVYSNGGGSNTFFIESGSYANVSGGGSHNIYVKDNGTLDISGGGGSISVYYEQGAIINNTLSGGGSNIFTLCATLVFDYSIAPNSPCNPNNCSNNLTLTPLFSTHQTGSYATFTATTSDLNPSFIWQSDFGQGFQTLNNFGNYSGVNTAMLNIANVQLPNHTQPIRVISTSGNCIDTSNVAVINILDTCITNVTVYDTLLTTVTDTLVINAQITGINPPNNLNTLKVFPNPASTHITIDYGNFNAMSGYTLTIVNSIGQTVFTTPINQQTSYIDLSTWTGNGIYFVQLIDPQNNTIENRKIVIQ